MPDQQEPEAVALEILSRISTMDSGAPIPEPLLIEQWAAAIARSGLGKKWLLEGVMRVYGGGGDPPRNRLGAILDEAREARRIAGQGSQLRQLRAGGMPSRVGEPLSRAYAVDDAIGLPCVECRAQPGEYCADNGLDLRIPHTSRLARAYRENNPEGRRRHEERQEHLVEHRRTWKGRRTAR